MKDNNLEKHFRDGLRDLEASPPDGAKDAIEKHLLDAGLLKDKADTPGGLWMFVVLAVLIATPVVYALKKTHVIKFEATNTADNTVVSDAKNIAYNSNSNRKENVLTELRNASSNTSKLNVAIKNDKKQASIKHKKTKIKSESINATYLAVEGKAKKNKKVSPTKINAEKNQNISDLVVTTDNSNDISASIQPSIDLNGSLAVSSEEKPEPDKLEEKQDTLAEKQHKTLKDTSSHPKLPREKIHKEIAFDFSGAPQFNSIVYGNGTEYYQQYVEESRKSEKETPSFCAAFGIVVSMNKFLAETGIRHSVLASEFSFEQTVVTYHRTRTYGNPPIWGQDSAQTTTHYIATNKIAFMEFPLLAGYRLQAGKFKFELKAGPIMSFITSANTTVISLNTGTVVQSNDLENSPYRKTCWSIFSAGNVLYSLNSRLSAFVEPSVKTGITSLFKESAPVTKKVQSVAVGIGLRVKL